MQRKDKDLKSGREDIRQDMYNIREDELAQFDSEFRNRRTEFEN